MLGYLNYVNLSDGQHSVKINGASEITIRTKDGEVIKVLTGDFKTNKPRNPNYEISQFIIGHTIKRKGKLIEELRYGKHFKDKEVMIPYADKTWTGVNGEITRRTTLFDLKGVCRTEIIRGRFKRQRFFYANGVKAYEFKRQDTELKAIYPRGTPALEIAGIALDYKEYYAKDLLNTGKTLISDFRKFGDQYSFKQYDRRGKVKDQGTFKNRQRVGAWIINYKEQAYYNGLMVDKEFLTLKPEDIKASRILKESNSQIRSMLIAKIGLERLVKEIKGKVIHQDGANRLIELPVKCDDGNGDENGSGVRVLQVKCPSTQNDYFLGVPDFVWDNGNKTKLDTCEKARQWGFQNDDGEEIKWLKET